MASTQEPIDSRGLNWKLILLLVPFLVSGYLAWKKWEPMDPWSYLPEPLAEVEVEDGSVLEVFSAVVASEFTHHYPVHDPFISFGSSNSSGTYALNQFELDTKSSKDRLESSKLRCPFPCLFLSVRLLDSEKSPIVSDHLHMNHDPNRHYVVEWEDGYFRRISDRLGAPELSYWLEVEDGAGGWIRCSSPWVVHQEEGRAFVTVPVFPRDEPDLRIRLQIPELDPIEFKLTNPGYRSSFSTWTAEAPPHQKNLGVATISISRVSREEPWWGGNPYALLGYEITATDDVEKGYYAYNHGAINDAQGNTIGKGYGPLPGTQVLRYSGSIYRRNVFPWSQTDVRIFLEGTYDDATKEVVFPPVDEVGMSGLQELTFKLDPASSNWQFIIKGKCHQSALPEAATNFTDLILFLDGADRSKLRLDAQGHSRSSSNDLVEYEAKYSFDRSFNPGQKVEIGIPNVIAPPPFEFFLSADPPPPPKAKK